ncbi:carbohydrate-binding module family 50 protein [Dothidotthia symphoricarpi CBS 119687]|uniref:Carbohydrate-binding module family 50 protein n=1 Tax=Dothidotthia symphoricarpi CBS 119687 TaxID=1392245 RepID=A0A6A6A387_9PLEO|nr:carbohydrate-binding module family 50 protein [Dothidotthia symphoricarpi CBS 119687]KAF2125623.1 carbohydrate-binding module family 50 protein [Dothidotthia symphoricarpi CBS 119687]
MSRFTDADDDTSRLPPGFQRTGYDASTQTYTFTSPTGALYTSLPGNRYGELHPAGQPPVSTPAETAAREEKVRSGHAESVRMMMPFVLLVLVFLGLVLRYVAGGGGEGGRVECAVGTGVLRVKAGDTCWGIAEGRGVGVEELLALGGNEGVDCGRLGVGTRVCVPV